MTKVLFDSIIYDQGISSEIYKFRPFTYRLTNDVASLGMIACRMCAKRVVFVAYQDNENRQVSSHCFLILFNLMLRCFLTLSFHVQVLQFLLPCLY